MRKFVMYVFWLSVLALCSATFLIPAVPLFGALALFGAILWLTGGSLILAILGLVALTSALGYCIWRWPYAAEAWMEDIENQMGKYTHSG